MAATPTEKHAQRVSWTLVTLAVSLMAGEWILLVAGTRRDEMIVGAASILGAALFLRLVHQTTTLRLRFTVADVAAAWRIPWYLLSGNAEIVVVLFKDAFGLHPADSLYRVCGFSTAKDDPLLVTRRVLATAYTTAAPNFIILGIDPAQSRMLFHQIRRSSVQKMVQELGAKP